MILTEGNMRGLIMDLRGKFIKVKETHGATIPAEVLFANRTVLASFLDQDKTISDLVGEIEIVDFKFWRLTPDSETQAIYVTLECNHERCYLELNSPKLFNFVKESWEKLTWLVNECELDKFAGKFFEFVVIEGMLKHDFAAWNSKQLKTFLVDCKATVASKDSDKKSENYDNKMEEKKMENEIKGLSDQKMMEALGAVIGGIVKGTGAITVKGKVSITFDIDASRTRDKNGERKLDETMKVNAGIELGIDLDMSASMDADLNGSCKVEGK